MHRLIYTLLIISVGAFAQTPVSVVTAFAPHYPPIATAERVSEVIAVKVEISSRGDVTEAHALSGVNIFLRKESEMTAKQWIFNAAQSEKREALLKFSYVILDAQSEVDPDVRFRPPFEVEIHQHPKPTSGPLANCIPAPQPLRCGYDQQIELLGKRR